jgi:7-cyano-7-deazaguanine reductase
MPKPTLLETFANPFPGRDYEIVMTCPEFTALCPVGGIETDATELAALGGGAPDFGTITIRYVPDRRCIELKSLKLYLWSFRNDGIFYERAVNTILDDLSRVARPRSMSVEGDFNVRGGIKSVITARMSARARGSTKGKTG